MSEPFNLPTGVLLTDLEDDAHFVSGEDPQWEAELEKADDREGDDEL